MTITITASKAWVDGANEFLAGFSDYLSYSQAWLNDLMSQQGTNLIVLRSDDYDASFESGAVPAEVRAGGRPHAASTPLPVCTPRCIAAHFGRHRLPPRPPIPASRAQGAAAFSLEFSMNAADLVTAEGETDKIVAALTTAAESTGVDTSGAEVVVSAARRRLLASFKVTVTFYGSAGDVQTLTTFFASAPNVAALLAALEAELTGVSSLVILTVAASASAPATDESWIGIPIGCSLARGTLRCRRCSNVLVGRTALALERALMRLRQQLTLT